MKILWTMDFNCYGEGTGGGDIFSTRVLAKGLKAKGHELDTVNPVWSEGPLPWYVRTVHTARRFGRMIGAILRDDPPSVLVAQNNVYPYVIQQARRYNVATVLVVRDKRYRCPNFAKDWGQPCPSSCAWCVGKHALATYPWFRHHMTLMREMALASDAQVVPSTHIAEDMRRALPGTDPTVVYPPIDDSHVPEVWEPTDVVYMGKGAYKGADIVASTAEELRSRDYSFRIYARQEPEHEAKFSTLPNVKVCGFRPRQEIFQHARVVVAPARWSEPAGRNVCEAVYMGVPCVISDRGGVPETMGPGGIVVPDAHLEDPAYWAEAIDDLMSGDDWDNYSRAAKEHGQMMAAPKMVDRFEKVLEGVV